MSNSSERDTFNRLKYDGRYYASAHACVSDLKNLVNTDLVDKFHIKGVNEDGLKEVWIHNTKVIYIRGIKLNVLASGRFHCLAVCPLELIKIEADDPEFWTSFKY